MNYILFFIKQNIKKYKKRVISKIITSTFLKTKFNILLMMLITLILEFHINIFLCYIFIIHPYIDFFIQIIITIIISLNTKIIFNFVFLFEKKIYNITKYFINNYSINNFILWKQYFILIISSIIILILLFYEFNKYKIILQIIQTIISCFILDKINEDDYKKKKKKITTRVYRDVKNNCTYYIKIYDENEKLKIKTN